MSLQCLFAAHENAPLLHSSTFSHMVDIVTGHDWLAASALAWKPVLHSQEYDPIVLRHVELGGQVMGLPLTGLHSLISTQDPLLPEEEK